MITNTLTYTTQGRQFAIFLNNRILFAAKVSPGTQWFLTARTNTQNLHTLWLYLENKPIALFQSNDADLVNEVLGKTTEVLNKLSPQLKISRTAGLVLILGIILTVSFTTTFIARNLSLNPAPNLPVISSPVTMPAAPAVGEPALLDAQTAPGAIVAPLSAAEMQEAQQQLAARLKTAAEKKEFTVTLSSGHERTLYLFSDPECNNCRIFEPTIQALAQHYNVEIFPVTLIGKARTAERVVPLLCAAPEFRAQKWRNLFDFAAGPLTSAQDKTIACNPGYDALARNDMAFDMFGLPGTPTVISDDGRMIPLKAMTSDAALKSFLEGVEG